MPIHALGQLRIWATSRIERPSRMSGRRIPKTPRMVSAERRQSNAHCTNPALDYPPSPSLSNAHHRFKKKVRASTPWVLDTPNFSYTV